MRLLLFVVLAAFSVLVAAQTQPSPEESSTTHSKWTTDFQAPNEFPSKEELHRWAHPFSNNSVLDVQELFYKKYRILAVFRSHTSGVFSSEPVIYIGLKDDASDSRLFKVLNVMSSYRKGVSAVIEGRFLVLYQTSPETRRKTEYARFNLGVLP